MKKLSNVLMATLVAVGGFFTSCTPEEDILAPTISFDNAPNNEWTLDPGVTTFKLNATITSIAEKLKTVKVLLDDGTNAEQVGTTVTKFDDKLIYNLKQDITLSPADPTKDQTYTVIVTADNGKEKQSKLTLKYVGKEEEPAGGEINTYTAVLLGAQSATDGSAYGTSNNTVYTVSTAPSNSALVDFIYFYQDGGDLAELFAPSSSKNNLNGYKDMATKNATLLKKVTSVTNFEDISDDAAIVTACEGISGDAVTNLAKDEIVAFKTAANKVGLFKVSDLKTGASGRITLTVKVQK